MENFSLCLIILPLLVTLLGLVAGHGYELQPLYDRTLQALRAGMLIDVPDDKLKYLRELPCQQRTCTTENKCRAVVYPLSDRVLFPHEGSVLTTDPVRARCSLGAQRIDNVTSVVAWIDTVLPSPIYDSSSSTSSSSSSSFSTWPVSTSATRALWEQVTHTTGFHGATTDITTCTYTEARWDAKANKVVKVSRLSHGPCQLEPTF